MVAAAVILDPERIPRGLNNSKKLSPEEREKLYAKICATAEVAVAFGSTDRIDRDNILRASLWALARRILSRSMRQSSRRQPRSRSSRRASRALRARASWNR